MSWNGWHSLEKQSREMRESPPTRWLRERPAHFSHKSWRKSKRVGQPVAWIKSKPRPDNLAIGDMPWVFRGVLWEQPAGETALLLRGRHRAAEPEPLVPGDAPCPCQNIATSLHRSNPRRRPGCERPSTGAIRVDYAAKHEDMYT